MNINKALLVLEQRYVMSKSKEEENILCAVKDIIIALGEEGEKKYVTDIASEKAYNAGVVATYELFASLGKEETWKKITNYCFKDFIK